MNKPDFVYVTHIAASPERVWDAITDPDLSAAYWGHRNVSDWTVGARWDHRRLSDPSVSDVTGEVLEAQRPHRLVVTWSKPGGVAAASTVTFEIEGVGPETRLTVIHDGLASDPDMKRAVQQGWPAVLSSLKTFLETGRGLDTVLNWREPRAA